VIPRHSLIVTTKHEITRDKTVDKNGVFLAGLNEVNLFNIENLVLIQGQGAMALTKKTANCSGVLEYWSIGVLAKAQVLIST
jgi:hypothetical protein